MRSRLRVALAWLRTSCEVCGIAQAEQGKTRSHVLASHDICQRGLNARKKVRTAEKDADKNCRQKWTRTMLVRCLCQVSSGELEFDTQVWCPERRFRCGGPKRAAHRFPIFPGFSDARGTLPRPLFPSKFEPQGSVSPHLHRGFVSRRWRSDF